MIPDFSKLEFDDEAGSGAATTDRESWLTPEGIDVKPFYTAEDLDGLDFLHRTREKLA